MAKPPATLLALAMYAGTTRKFTARFVQQGTTTAQDISGATIWCTAKYSEADPDVAAVFQKGNAGGLTGITITDAVNGVSEVTIAPADTAALQGQNTTLSLDIKLRFPNGEEYVAGHGTLDVLSTATATI